MHPPAAKPPESCWCDFGNTDRQPCAHKEPKLPSPLKAEARRGAFWMPQWSIVAMPSSYGKLIEAEAEVCHHAFSVTSLGPNGTCCLSALTAQETRNPRKNLDLLHWHRLTQLRTAFSAARESTFDAFLTPPFRESLQHIHSSSSGVLIKQSISAASLCSVHFFRQTTAIRRDAGIPIENQMCAGKANLK